MVHKNKETTNYFLYTLNDTTGIRYVGITKQSLNARLNAHISSCKQAFKNKKSRHKRHCWIKSLLDQAEFPTIHLLKTFDNKEDAVRAEIETIANYKIEYNLVNGTSGGDGVNDHKWTDFQKESRSIKIDQYDLNGNFIKTHESMADASLDISGTKNYNGKVSACVKGKRGRRTFFGYVLRLHNEPFDKYPIKHTKIMTPEMKKNYSNSKLGDKNPMKRIKSLDHHSSRPVIVLNSEDIILTISDSVKDSILFTKLSKSCVNKILKHNIEIANFKLIYASEDIVQSLQKCKSSTLKTFVGQKINILEVG
jgi:hypothetical protein